MAHRQSVRMRHGTGPNGPRHRKSATWGNIFLGFDLWNIVRESANEMDRNDNVFCGRGPSRDDCGCVSYSKRKKARLTNEAGFCKNIIPAATYSPTHLRMSTIGGGRLNF